MEAVGEQASVAITPLAEYFNNRRGRGSGRGATRGVHRCGAAG